jgi:CheY-like chemotaxis protein
MILEAMPAMRVLLVEDELLVRMFAADALVDAGFQVAEAGSATEALTLMGQPDTRCDALIIDLGLPDHPGDELAHELRARHPDLPIVIASGRSAGEIRGRFDNDTHVGILVNAVHGGDAAPRVVGGRRRRVRRSSN